MSRPNRNNSKQRELLLGRLTALEQLIVQIDGSYAAASATYHDSELAARSIDNARVALEDAVKSLARGHYDRVERLLNVTWFYAKFAQDIIDAEATEHLLGRGYFIDLIEPAALVQIELFALLEQTEAMLEKLAAMIPEPWLWV
ncbi:MAG: hypothetical protein KGS72_26125 [Cyanobacteria bacterium REEB67]|nr:hypothetical protein [Cyanobacteria bacterium REEB67]